MIDRGQVSGAMIYLYQAYGPMEISEQVVFSLLSLHPYLGPRNQIVLYTDRVDFFSTFFRDVFSAEQLICRPLSPEQIQIWKGPQNFVHRLKICMIQDALRLAKVPQKFGGREENIRRLLLYLDGDTVFVQSPQEITARLLQNQLVMHENEGQLNKAPNVLTKKIYKTLRKTSLSFSLPAETTMHNAGVLGLTSLYGEIVDRTLAISDELYKVYPKHVMEQLAFSLSFEQAFPIFPATREIHHYWRTKNESFAKVHQFLQRHPFAEHALKSSALPKLIEFFRSENESLLTRTLARGKVAGSKQSWWRRWWQRRS